MYQKKGFKIAVEVVVYMLFTWFSLYLLSNLGLRLVDIFDLNVYLTLFKEKVLILFMLLFSLGVSTSILLIAARQMKKKISVPVAAASAVVGVLPLFIMVEEEIVFYGFTALFYVLGIIFVAYISYEHREHSAISAFEIGWNSIKKVFYIVAIGAFIGSMIFVSANRVVFEDSFKEVVADSIKTGETISLSKEQISNMVGNTYDPTMFQMDKNDIRLLLKSTTPELSPDVIIAMNYPDFDSYTEEQKLTITHQVNEYVQSDEYTKNIEASVEKQVDTLYNQLQDPEYIKEMENNFERNMDSTVDKIYNKMNDEAYREDLAENAQSIMDSMPIIGKMFRFMPIIVAITIFSVFMFAELVSSFVAGIIFMLHYALFHSSGRPDNDSLGETDIEEYSKSL